MALVRMVTHEFDIYRSNSKIFQVFANLTQVLKIEGFFTC